MVTATRRLLCSALRSECPLLGTVVFACSRAAVLDDEQLNDFFFPFDVAAQLIGAATKHLTAVQQLIQHFHYAAQHEAVRLEKRKTIQLLKQIKPFDCSS